MLGEVGGFFVVGLQLVVIVLFILVIIQMHRLVKDVKNNITDTCEAMIELPSNVLKAQWSPLAVAAVASLFQIKPIEVLSEYRKENDAKKWIVLNTFPESKLTKRFLNNFDSRFMTLGYDFKPHASLPTGAASTRSTRSGLSQVKTSKTDVRSSTDKKSSSEVKKSASEVKPPPGANV